MIPRSRVVLSMFSVVFTADAMLMRSESSGRYFTKDGMLPPLVSLSAVRSNQTTSVPYVEDEGRSIPVVYTNDPCSVEEWLSENLPTNGCTIGFDVESKPSYVPKKGRDSFREASTVQLATTDSCLVVHLAHSSGRHSQACAPILKSVLCDEQFIKAGCALDGDMMALYELWGGLDAKSRLDLGCLGTGRRNNDRYGLKTLTHAVLGVDLPKPKNIATSDWSSVPLTHNQIIYSARDAWAGAAIAQKLAEYDPESFGHETLIEKLSLSEVPISKLVVRQRRRDRARSELQKLLAPYRSHAIRMPKGVSRKAQRLRKVIKKRVIDPNLVLEKEHFDLETWK